MFLIFAVNRGESAFPCEISDEIWLKLTTEFECIFTGAVGTAEHLCEFSDHVGLQRTQGIANAQACLNST